MRTLRWFDGILIFGVSYLASSVIILPFIAILPLREVTAISVVVLIGVSYIWVRAITGDPLPVAPHIEIDPAGTQHIYLICSDGLYNMVDEEFIASVLASSSVFQARDYLLKQAYANGATDNITFQIIKPFDDEKTIS